MAPSFSTFYFANIRFKIGITFIAVKFSTTSAFIGVNFFNKDNIIVWTYYISIMVFCTLTHTALFLS